MRTAVLCFHGASESWTHSSSIAPQEIVRHARAIRRFRPVHATFDDAYRSIEDVAHELLRLGIPVTVFVVTVFADRGGAPLQVDGLIDEDPRELATLDWNGLRALVAAGANVGSHTATHRHLVRLSDDELATELSLSRERVEAEIGGTCRVLAYPYGEHDGRVRTAARTAGYERAYTLRGPGGDEYAYPRVELTRKDGVVRASLKGTPLYNVLGELVGRFGRTTPPRRAMD
jgi:peptidoglycan/xylan/chitin deacetylase (PgdA/CDA1 family)